MREGKLTMRTAATGMHSQLLQDIKPSVRTNLFEVYNVHMHIIYFKSCLTVSSGDQIQVCVYTKL